MEQGSKRLTYLDFIRGVAVLGLLLMNLPFMGVAEFGYGLPTVEVFSDDVVRTLNAFLFDSRFRTLFCLLFGIGLYLQFTSYKAKELEPYPILKSRLNWLLIFGLIHCVLIWPGDILIWYALSGRVLLSHLDLSTEELIKKGINWSLVGFMILIVSSISFNLMETSVVARDSEVFIEAFNYSTAHYFSDLDYNFAVAATYVLTFPILVMPYMCGLMFLGIGLFKSGALKYGFDSKLLKTFIIAAIVLSALDVFLILFHMDLWNYIPNVVGSFSGFFMALIIWHYVLKTKVFAGNGRVVRAIRNVGTMAFTFYIFQSLVGTILLQVIFPEWVLSFTLIHYFLLSCSLIVFQLILAMLYKSQFKQGPLELLWRRLVNRKIDEIKQQAEKQESLTNAQKVTNES